MLDLQTIYRIQSEHSVSSGNIRDKEFTLAEYIEQCRIFLANNLPPEYETVDTEKKALLRDDVVAGYIDKHKVRVEGYLNSAGLLDVGLLQQHVLDILNGEGIIKDALEDPDVEEIQINDKNTLFVVKNGEKIPYLDMRGRQPRFTDDSEILMLVIRLISDSRGTVPPPTEGAPLLNAKTFKKQYRINVVHPIANAMDKGAQAFPITTVTLRKFNDISLVLEDLVRLGSIPPKIARFFKLMGKVKQNVFFIGATSSGKTTLMSAASRSIPLSERIICIQNPTEITFFERDSNGVNLRNVLHWEARDDLDSDDSNKSTNTMQNLLSNVLRCTPDVLILGESRAPDEFLGVLRAGNFGQRILCTYHSDSPMSAINRAAVELQTAMGGDLNDLRRQWASIANIMIIQKKYPGGKRRILEIAEVLVDEQQQIQVSTLFKYEPGAAVLDPNTHKQTISGEYRQLNTISKRFVASCIDAAIPKSEYVEFQTIVEDVYEGGINPDKYSETDFI